MMYKGIKCVILGVSMLNLMTAFFGQATAKSDVPPHMITKWKEFFDINDENKDGKIDKTETGKHIHLIKGALESEVSETVNQAIQNVKDAYRCAYFRYGSKPGYVGKQEYLDGLKKLYLKDPQKFKKHFSRCVRKYTTSVDINNDGRISWTEYKIHMRHAFVIKKEILKDDFLKWNPSIPDKEFMKVWVQFQSKDKTNRADKEMKKGLFNKPKEK